MRCGTVETTSRHQCTPIVAGHDGDAAVREPSETANGHRVPAPARSSVAAIGMRDNTSIRSRAVQARLDEIDEELTPLGAHAEALTRAIGELRHELRRNAEARERNPGHEATRAAHRLHANLQRNASELEATRARMERLRGERERLLAGIPSSR